LTSSAAANDDEMESLRTQIESLEKEIPKIEAELATAERAEEEFSSWATKRYPDPTRYGSGSQVRTPVWHPDHGREPYVLMAPMGPDEYEASEKRVAEVVASIPGIEARLKSAHDEIKRLTAQRTEAAEARLAPENFRLAE
jgi:septal ring factor EnvC (AmiA/AmiB activator)